MPCALATDSVLWFLHFFLTLVLGAPIARSSTMHTIAAMPKRHGVRDWAVHRCMYCAASQLETKKTISTQQREIRSATTTYIPCVYISMYSISHHFDIISYHINYNVVYYFMGCYIVSYHTISYHIIPYHIILYILHMFCLNIIYIYYFLLICIYIVHICIY